MEPLHGGASTLYQELTVVALIVVVLAAMARRGTISFSFLVLALFFYVQAQSVVKAWPIVGVFLPLLVLGSGALHAAPPPSAFKLWANVFGHFLATVILASCLYLKLNPTLPTSIQAHWRELDRGRSELSVEAIAWMKSHGVAGRLFHRCEDGGLLQQEGYNQGETFADTGFGKYDEAFIHEVGSVGERPGLLPRYLAAYRPDFVVCSTFCYQWPFYLRQSSWRLIFYTPNSSVWTRPGLRTDLPTISDQEVEAAFNRDIATYGRPGDVRLYGRNLIALQSLGLENFAFAQLHNLPADLHHAAWYWEAARFICFSQPAASPAHRDDLLREAENLHDDVTTEFRAYAAETSGDTDGALGLLRTIPPARLGGYSAELLLKIELERKMPEALALALRPGSYDLRSGRHWQYLAQAEEQAGHLSAAAASWKKAVFYYPDDAELMTQAAAFEVRYPDPDLSRVIADSAKVYGLHQIGVSGGL